MAKLIQIRCSWPEQTQFSPSLSTSLDLCSNIGFGHHWWAMVNWSVWFGLNALNWLANHWMNNDSSMWVQMCTSTSIWIYMHGFIDSSVYILVLLAKEPSLYGQHIWAYIHEKQACMHHSKFHTFASLVQILWMITRNSWMYSCMHVCAPIHLLVNTDKPFYNTGICSDNQVSFFIRQAIAIVIQGDIVLHLHAHSHTTNVQ